VSLVGKTMAFTSIQFKNEKDQVFARGSHTKYIALAHKDPNNIVEELTPKSEKKE
jgi:acyl-coenzyme A thioesterase 13